MRIAIHGLGYVGTTCAVHFANADFSVVGYDPSLEVVAAFNRKQPKAGEFLGYLGQQVKWENLTATNVRVDTEDADVHVVCVPTERMGSPCTDIVEETLHFLVDEAKAGALIIVESTLIPGTIDRVAQATDFKVRVGSDLFLAVAPRRDWFADPEKNLHTLPRVVGGYTRGCTTRAMIVLSKVSPHILVTDYRTAEITKSLENALLHVPLMLAHQLAYALPHHNVAEALRLASTHWRLIKGMHLNFGTGGRCVPLGTQYLETAANGRFTIGIEANDFEIQMRNIVAQSVFNHKPPPAKALVMGVAYRPEFRDMGLSPGLSVANHLDEAGYTVHVTDPMWSNTELETLTGLDCPAECRYEDYDVILLATPHKRWEYYDAPALKKGALVLDAQGFWAKHKNTFEKDNVKYVQVGTPGWTGEEK